MPKPTFLNLPEQKRNLIVDVAIDEFAEHGYQGASISRIVRRANIAKGSFYQYFEDKADLYRHLFDLAAAEKMAFLQDNAPPQPQMGLFTYLRWVVKVGLDFQFAHPKLAQLGHDAVIIGNSQKEGVLAQLKSASSAYYSELVEMGIRNGDIDKRVDVDLAEFVLSTLMNNFGAYLAQREMFGATDLACGHLSEPSRMELQEQIEALLSIIEHGLCGPNPAIQNS